MSNFAALTVLIGMELLALIALLGDRQFALHENIPVYWRGSGSPNLYVRRRLGLAVFPVAGTVLLLVMALNHEPVYLLAATQLSLATLNILYFRAIGRAIREA